jgi:hypothetical protein
MRQAQMFNPAEAAELVRLEEERVRADLKAKVVLRRRGRDSLEFLEANRTIRGLVSRIKRLKGSLASRDWLREEAISA